jgi:hypothetical protein
MSSPSITIRGGPRIRILVAAVAISVGFFANTVLATEASTHRFALIGSATITRDAPTLRNDTMSLRSYLAPSDTAVANSAIVQDGGRFTLMAKAVVATQVCYNDTIFRDDFDGDGG